MKKPIIGITMGDAAGIGPEVIVKALASRTIYEECRPLVIGDVKVLNCKMQNAKCKMQNASIEEVGEAQFRPGAIEVIDLDNIDLDKLDIGQVSEEAGRASIEYIKEATNLALKGKIDALVTAPISKEAINRAGFNYYGHTDLLAELTNTKDYVMCFISPSLKVALATIHIPLREVTSSLNSEGILTVINLVHEALINYFAITKPEIGVAGVNPHAGEGGLFGREEEMVKIAINQAQRSGIDARGPYPADTLFTKENLTSFDCFVAMYHDQGLIPVKLLDFDRAVNVTLGLPFIRTSPDHGTAFDIAGKGVANPSSMIEAISLAAQMARTKANLPQRRGETES